MVVAAHPDDEALGCGGTIAKLATAGATVRVAFIADGISARMDSCGHGSAQACGASGSSRESLRAPRRQRGLFRRLPRQPPRYRTVIVAGAVRRSADCKASAGDAPDPPRRRSQRRSSTRASSRRDGLPAPTRLARSERCSRLRCRRARSGSLQVPAGPSRPTGSWTYPARWTGSSRLWMPMQSRCATGRTHVRAKPSSTWRAGAAQPSAWRRPKRLCWDDRYHNDRLSRRRLEACRDRPRDALCHARRSGRGARRAGMLCLPPARRPPGQLHPLEGFRGPASCRRLRCARTSPTRITRPGSA